MDAEFVTLGLELFFRRILSTKLISLASIGLFICVYMCVCVCVCVCVYTVFFTVAAWIYILTNSIQVLGNSFFFNFFFNWMLQLFLQRVGL